MAVSKQSQRLGDSPPDPNLEDAAERDLAAQDVDHREEITPKRALMMCESCGATSATPDL